MRELDYSNIGNLFRVFLSRACRYIYEMQIMIEIERKGD